jgi:hypothetical protein
VTAHQQGQVRAREGRVIQGNARARFGDAVERVEALLVGNPALGDLENQLPGAGAQSGLRRRVIEAAAAEDFRGNVDGNVCLGVRAQPAVQLRGHGVDNPVSDEPGQGRAVNGGHEATGVHRGAIGPPPANERLGPQASAILEGNDRLVFEEEFAPLESRLNRAQVEAFVC